MQPRLTRMQSLFFVVYLSMIWPWSEPAGMSTPRKIGCFKCFPLASNLSQYRMMDFKLDGNDLITLPRLMGSNSCFSKIIVDVFSPWIQVLIHTWMLQTSKLPKPLKSWSHSHLIIKWTWVTDQMCSKDLLCWLYSAVCTFWLRSPSKKKNWLTDGVLHAFNFKSASL